MQDREIMCIYYDYEGGCAKGRDGTFYKKCQTCDLYSPRKRTAPNRKDLKKEKLRKQKERDFKRNLRDY